MNIGEKKIKDILIHPFSFPKFSFHLHRI